MSTEKVVRYTAEQFAKESEWEGYKLAREHVPEMLRQAARTEAEVAGLVEVLKEGRRAIGDHYAPNDCYATGPLTGNDYRDIVECPACSFIAMYDKAIARNALGEG